VACSCEISVAVGVDCWVPVRGVTVWNGPEGDGDVQTACSGTFVAGWEEKWDAERVKVVLVSRSGTPHREPRCRQADDLPNWL